VGRESGHKWTWKDTGFFGFVPLAHVGNGDGPYKPNGHCEAAIAAKAISLQVGRSLHFVRNDILTSLQKGLFTAETAEYAEQY
jgi:hypothetical protein